MGLDVSISREEYIRIDAVRATELKIAAKSLFHYKQYKDGKRDISGKQKGWDLGTLAHSFCLENDESGYVVFLNTKESVNQRATKDFKDLQKKTRLLITKEELEDLKARREAFWSGCGVREVMSGCEVEKAFVCEDPITGLRLKCLADFVNLHERRFGDFKGVPDASEFGVAKMAARAKWPIQIGHYAYVIERATGIRMERFDFVGQETKSPFYTEAHQLSEFDLENCLEYYRELLNRLAVAIKEDHWPGYKRRGCLSLPQWAYEFEEMEMD